MNSFNICNWIDENRPVKCRPNSVKVYVDLLVDDLIKGKRGLDGSPMPSVIMSKELKNEIYDHVLTKSIENLEKSTTVEEKSTTVEEEVILNPYDENFIKSFKEYAKININSLSTKNLNDFFDEYKKKNDCWHNEDIEYQRNLVKDIYEGLYSEMNTLKVGDVISGIEKSDIWGTIISIDPKKKIGHLDSGRIVKFKNQNITWRKLYIDHDLEEEVPDILDVVEERPVRNFKTKKFMGCIEKVVDDDGEIFYILNTGRTIKKDNQDKEWYFPEEKSILTYNTWGTWKVPLHGIEKLNKFYNKFRLSNNEKVFSEYDHDLHYDEYLADLVKADKKEGTNLFPNLYVNEFSYEDYCKGYYRIDEHDGREDFEWNRDASVKDDEVSKLEKELANAKKNSAILQGELIKMASTKSP